MVTLLTIFSLSLSLSLSRYYILSVNRIFVTLEAFSFTKLNHLELGSPRGLLSSSTLGHIHWRIFYFQAQYNILLEYILTSH